MRLGGFEPATRGLEGRSDGSERSRAKSSEPAWLLAPRAFSTRWARIAPRVPPGTFGPLPGHRTPGPNERLTWSNTSRGEPRLRGCPRSWEQRTALGSDGG